MSNFYEKLGFVKNPYERLNPYLIEEKFLEWDRPDLPNAKKDLERFTDDVIEGRRVGLRIFGPTGSGKTWLTKIINKKLSEKSKTLEKPIVFIYTLIPAVEPTFSVMYQEAIDHFLRHDFKIISKYIEKTYGNLTPDNWKKVVDHNELAHVLAWISSGFKYWELAKKWIRAERISTSEISTLGFTYAIDGDYRRLNILKELLFQLSKNFAPVVFVIDELENAPPKLTSGVGDSLRSLLDDFSDNFALIASFTAEKEDEWYEMGYSAQLSRRFDYLIRLDSVKSEHMGRFLKEHHKLYLDQDHKNQDLLMPFKEDALKKLLELMAPEYHYPGFILPDCGILARIAVEKSKKIIDSQFVEDNQETLKNR